MPYMPEARDMRPPYWCPNCRAWFLVSDNWVSLIQLGPGMCEHSGETKLVPETIPQQLEVDFIRAIGNALAKEPGKG